ncbi:MAG: UDP-N-acetylmuramoyl-tripeptide--D-alanyl-D-alanine ligase [Xanthomonadales bacterium]|jgi:UDP-N-acetylmuramoyl-tripeptide--D-alanyl-D-alanine ligase|nr:UDP-N-acetylmuramoyl-tripeptide--D-alanyl-D-alanine ligase [Xanthomonadales bacterium]
MIRMPLDQVAAAVGAAAAGPGAPLVMGVDIDSRRLRAGALFVAIRGERTDGHDHLASARAAGAVAALVSRPVDDPLPQLLVADTVRALGDLARVWRHRLPTRIAALTGSNGKTTVKTLAAAILGEVGTTRATPGNLNNEIGLPLTVLSLDPADRFAVLEMGAGQPGDIAWLAGIGLPHAALVNNVGPAHLQRLGSVEGVAREKSAIYAALPAEGISVLPADDAQQAILEAAAAGHRLLRFGLSAAAEVRASDLQVEADVQRFTLHAKGESADVALALAGVHNVRNALAASALALALGATLEDCVLGLSQVTAVPGRLAARLHPSGARIFDDSYNANPASVRAGIEALCGRGERVIAVLGDMAELGPTGPALHRELGAWAAAQGVEALLALGPLGRETVAGAGRMGQHHEQLDGLLAALQPRLAPGVTVLVKGSRSAGMERVVRALFADAAPAAEGH